MLRKTLRMLIAHSVVQLLTLLLLQQLSVVVISCIVCQLRHGFVIPSGLALVYSFILSMVIATVSWET